MHKNKFQTDKYRKARGGNSRWLSLSCGKCGRSLFKYQKDGPGILKRLYIDRIDDANIPLNKNLVCAGCGAIIGNPIIYKREGRPALRLSPGVVKKQIIK